MSIRPLPACLVKKAEKEINERPGRVPSDITAIKDWLSKQSHLESVRPTDEWIVAFLRGSKFSLERCKEKIDMYYTLKAIVPEFFENRDPSGAKIQEMLKLGVFLPLRSLAKKDSPRACLIRLGVFDPSIYNLADIIKVAFMVTEIMMLEDDNFTVAGEEVVVDTKDVGINVLSQWTPTLAKKIISSFEKALPVRLKKNHFLNTPPGFQTAYTIFRTFLPEKLKKRIEVHNINFNAMYKSVPKAILPAEYGGTEGELQELIDHWKAKVESYRDWFLQQEGARSDESKRSDGNVRSSSVLFGVEGSFRKLEVD